MFHKKTFGCAGNAAMKLLKKIRAQRVPRPGSYPDVIQRRNAGRRLKMAAKVQAQRQYCRNAAIPLAGSDAPKKERSVFYRGVERTAHPEAPVKITQPFVQSLLFQKLYVHSGKIISFRSMFF